MSPFTLLKSDFFVSGSLFARSNLKLIRLQAGLQKMSLPERIDGAPNFRRASLLFATETAVASGASSPIVYGSGMPTIDGSVLRLLYRSHTHKISQASSGVREDGSAEQAGRLDFDARSASS